MGKREDELMVKLFGVDLEKEQAKSETDRIARFNAAETKARDKAANEGVRRS